MQEYIPNRMNSFIHYKFKEINYYENYIKSNPDWELVNIYYDEGITDTYLKRRKVFNQMIADALYGKIDVMIISDINLIASKILTTKSKQKEFSKVISSIYHLNKDIIDYFTKFLIRKIYVADNDYFLYEFIDDTLYRYELGTWSIKENRKINRKRREFKNKDYWGKKTEED